MMHCYYVAISWTQILTLLPPAGVESFLGPLRWQLDTRRQLLVYHHMITRTHQYTSIIVYYHVTNCALLPPADAEKFVGDHLPYD